MKPLFGFGISFKSVALLVKISFWPVQKSSENKLLSLKIGPISWDGNVFCHSYQKYLERIHKHFPDLASALLSASWRAKGEHLYCESFIKILN